MVAKTTLAALPDVEGLLKLTQSLALLDAIMSPESEYRYYSFNSKWDEGEMMASMRNGSGDEYFILFDSLDLDAIEHIYRHEPLTAEIGARLNDEISLELLRADIEEIDYPRLISDK